MGEISMIMSIIGTLSSLVSILILFLTFRRNEKNDHKIIGKNEGIVLSDIGYIKACVDRVEKNLVSVDERYRNMAERLAKVEEAILNIKKNKK